MAPRDLHNWAENMEAGQESDPELRLAARLRSMAQPAAPTPAHLRVELRQQLLAQYDVDPALARDLRSAAPAPAMMPVAARAELRQRLLATYDIDVALVDRLKAASPPTRSAPQRLRLDLRQRLLNSYGRAVTPGQERASRSAAPRSSFKLRLVTSMVVLAALIWFSGGFTVGVTWAERVLSRIFVSDKPIPTPVVAPTVNPTDMARANKEIDRRQTAIAEAQRTGGIRDPHLQTLQVGTPFSISVPSAFPKGTTLAVAERTNASDGPGVYLRYQLPNNKFMEIREQQLSGVRTIIVNKETLVKEFRLKGHQAIIYNPGDIPGMPKTLYLEWTDGVVWLEILTTVDAKELERLAKSMAL